MATTSNISATNSNNLDIFSNILEINGNNLETFSNNLEINGNNGNNLETKNVKQKNICEFCNKQYNNYSGLWKHKKKCKEYTCIPISTDDSKIICEFCNKTYSDRSGLWRHKKICKKNTHENNNGDEKEDVVMLLIKENAELKNMIIKVLENVTMNNNINHSNNSNSNNNSNNKTFNLQFFLNETCKDAMNINEFIESLQLDLSDLENIGSLGYVDGISKIIIKHLKALDETMRPIHCTDKKRVTFYVKDDDKWEKDDDNKTRIRKAINDVANENTMLLPLWKAKHPDYLDSSSIYSDKYNNMVIEVLGGDDSNNVNENKIIKKIAQEVMIQKQ